MLHSLFHSFKGRILRSRKTYSFGVPMKLRLVSGLAAVVISTLLWMACGDYYRPVVIPLIPTPPTPSNQHTVFALTANVPGSPGTGMQIDVSGDADVGAANVNLPTHAALAPNDERLFVASAGSLVAGGTDQVVFLAPSSVFGGGLATTDTVSLPAGSLPDFVASTQDGFVYVANFGTNSVIALNTSTDQVINSAPVGNGPVAMVETPSTSPAPAKLYVANQGSNSITSLNAEDLTQNTVMGFSGSAPVWLVARGDGQKVYVLTQGDGQLITIDTATDTETGSVPVGAGANFVAFDANLNRLYVTNPVTQTLYVFSDTGGPNDTPLLLKSFSFASGSSLCPAGCSPSSVAALADGSRFYVASYQIAPTTCPDPNVSGPCVIPQLTVFNAQSLTMKIASVSLLSGAPFVANQFAVPPAPSCATPTPYTPGVTRFRVFTTASVDNSRVYVSMCDAGTIADIDTTGSNINNPGQGTPPDSLVVDLAAPPAACLAANCNQVASITAFSITNNVVTFQAANSFTPGENVTISGVTSYLNQVTLTVLATGLSSGQFECAFNHADVNPTAASGSAIPAGPPQTPFFLLTGK
jgi:YVTN family beta-propeller protein